MRRMTAILLLAVLTAAIGILAKPVSSSMEIQAIATITESRVDTVSVFGYIVWSTPIIKTDLGLPIEDPRGILSYLPPGTKALCRVYEGKAEPIKLVFKNN